MKQLQPDHAALQGRGRTIFMKAVKAPGAIKRLLQPASANGKLGKGKNVVSKGKWRGMPLYSLTLEERKTCATTCQQWRNCFGNNMPFANRVDHTESNFLSSLDAELETMASKHPQGFLIRLHVLGDFYSVGYVAYWKRKLKQHTMLHIFGYSHYTPEVSAIGRAIEKLNSDRCWIRFSDRGGPMSANVDGEGITCPEQTGKTESCLTCGLCWSTELPIKFLVH